MRKWLFIVLLLLALSACSEIQLQNVSEFRVRVLVRTPDNSQGYTRFLGPGTVNSVISGHGGRYSVTTLPDAQYEQLLNDIRDQITIRPF